MNANTYEYLLKNLDLSKASNTLYLSYLKNYLNDENSIETIPNKNPTPKNINIIDTLRIKKKDK